MGDYSRTNQAEMSQVFGSRTTNAPMRALLRLPNNTIDPTASPPAAQAQSGAAFDGPDTCARRSRSGSVESLPPTLRRAGLKASQPSPVFPLDWQIPE